MLWNMYVRPSACRLGYCNSVLTGIPAYLSLRLIPYNTPFKYGVNNLDCAQTIVYGSDNVNLR